MPPRFYRSVIGAARHILPLQDIADKAGVSIATVSNVVNGNLSKVSGETLSCIRELIRKWGYVPNSSARVLASKSSRIIAGILVGAEGSNLLKAPYNAQFFGETVRAVQGRGYYLMIRYVSSYEDVLQSFCSWNVDRAVFIGTPDAYVRRIQIDIAIPLVFTDTYSASHKPVVNNVGSMTFGVAF